MKKLLLFLVSIFSFITTLAQSPTDVVHTFGANPGYNGIVYDEVIQPDGKIIVGGGFTKYKGITCNRIVRLQADGSIDNTFIGNGFNDYIETIALQPDGKILVGGNFTEYSQTTTPISCSRIIRLNSDGSYDNTFACGYTFNDIVSKILVQSDGKILIGGSFDTYNNPIAMNGLVRVNADGSMDTEFNIGTGFDNYVKSLALQSDGKIIVVGGFTVFNDVNRNRIIRLNTDGTKDDTFSIGLGFDNSVENVVIQPNGNLLVCGYFSTYKNSNQYNLVRLLPNGSIDSSFSNGAGSPGNTLHDIALDASGNIYVVGNFSNFNGIAKKNCAKLNSSGTLDASFNLSRIFPLQCISTTSDEKLIIGGDYFLSRFLANGTQDTTFDYGSGFNNAVYSTAAQADGKFLVGGYFDSYQFRPQNGIIRFNADGSKDNTFTVGSGLSYGSINSIVVLPNSKIIAAGDFNNYRGVTISNIMRLNPDSSIDATFSSGHFDGIINNVVAQSDGKLLVGGTFAYYNGQMDTNLLRLNSDGSKDESFQKGTSFNGQVRSIVLQPDGKILVGGCFTIYNGEPHYGIVRLLSNGTADPTFTTGDGFNDCVYSLALQPDGKILVGGLFNSYKTQSAISLIRLNADGSRDTTFDSGNNIHGVLNIVLQEDGKIIAGSSITNEFNSVYKNLIRFNTDGTPDASFDIGSGFDSGSAVSSLSILSNGNILVGGSFDVYNSVTSSKLILLNGTPVTPNPIVHEKLDISPNPVSYYLTVQLPLDDTSYSYEIMDLSGKKIIRKSDVTGLLIDVQPLSKGIYFIKINSKHQSITKKFIKV